jgi:hypothetical protein
MRLVAAALLLSSSASAEPKRVAQTQVPAPASCLAELDARHVSYKRAVRPGIAVAVEVTGPLGGVTYASSDQQLVIDCSLAVSLAEAGRYLRALGFEKATFSSAYSRRNVRGTDRPSKHSYGLAIDVHTFTAPEPVGLLRIDRDYEQGLGDAVDCVGHPLTQGGAALKILQCQLVRSGLFHLVLSPDYDDAHHDHFHLETKPWSERTELRSQVPAIH